MKISILFLVAALVIAIEAVVTLVKKELAAIDYNFSNTAHLLAKHNMLPTDNYAGMR